MSKEETENEDCKQGKTEIPADAKGRKTPAWVFVAIVVVVALIVVSCVAGGGGDKSSKTVTTSADTSSAADTTSETAEAKPATADPEKDMYSVGDVADINGVQTTLVNVIESTGAEYSEPGDGNIYVLCEFEIYNNSTKDISVSSIVSFEAYCDDYSIDESFKGSLSPEAKGKKELGGSIAAGKKMNGYIAYEVPIDWKELEVKFSPSFWSRKGVTFVAKNDK